METATTIANQVIASRTIKGQSGTVCKSSETQHNTNSSRQKVEAMFDKVFSQLCDIRPAWRLGIKSIRNTKLQWVKAFLENGITTQEQVSKAFVHARKDSSDFFPSPGKFIAWCKASDNTSPQMAWLEACNHSHEVNTYRWSSPNVRQAGYLTGWYSIRTATGSEVETVRKTYIKHYDALCTKNTVQHTSEITRQQIEDHWSHKTASELVERQNEQLMKNRIIEEGFKDVKGMSAIKAMLGE